ncbi:MAG: Fe-Mn family superoxide dismutase [Acidobacteriota bacterium]|nr:Fe-Mn family superoxide dismutase [Blastocatellia bacterium]MDW8411340.1 Fe-Mn family superoxide dismutase [Acidobacteriota bacterium]
MKRRQVIQAMAVGSMAALIGSNTLAMSNEEKPAARPPAFAGTHKVKPLPYNPVKLRGLDETMINNHHSKNYAGTVAKLNKIEEALATLSKDAPAFVRAGLKREQLIAANSVILHEHYFDNLGGDGKPSGKIVELIKHHWGSWEVWEADFRGTGLALGGGSGWVVLTYSLVDGAPQTVWQADHTNSYAMGRPLLVMDMYEHSYQRQFGPAVAEYIDSFMANVNWDIVNYRLEQVEKLKLG